MIAGRPLLLLSLPSLAIIVGLVWYRRKFKPDAGDRGGEKSKECESTILSRGVSSTLAEHEPDMRQSSSLPIQQQAGGGGNGAENWDNCSGSGHSSAGSSRSAPIDIVPNKSPSKDDLLGRSHLLEHDNEELSFSPSIDLPGSVVSRYPQNLRKFNQMMEPTKEPVVIRPTKAASLQSGHFRVPDENGNANSAKPVSPRSPKKQSPQPKPYAAATESDRLNGNCVPEPDAATIEDVFDPKPESFDERNEQTGSPPLSICSVRSEDSGKGSSPPHSVGPSVTTYEFLVPAFLVAGMLGKQGTFVKQIKQKTGANVIIKRNPDTHNSKICTLEGSQQEIQDALAVIRKKFPQKRFPGLTLQRIEISRVETVIPLSLMNDTCSSLPLVEGINNDVAVSCIINVGHLFVHQPLHPTHLTLNSMQNSLNQSYTQSEAPALPEIVPNAVCVAFVAGSWYRAQVVQNVTESNLVLVKYLDYGGYSMLPPQNLRQIRTDFISVPFQSIECVLSNIQPIDESQNTWSEEATELFRRLTSNAIMQAQVAGYTAEGIPEIYLFSSIAKDNVVFINQEMVARGYARWID
ncbi:A-kinase anchor protein 1, mitochondrial isoform X2 [Anopheles gambiae]|uniref:A-kinase anchor protein 1, mitochondrial isoform X2 n=1 Tax=Anopheles gambiae TaxID=7165 RepID=UPI002AC91A6F|nr:A-kinase anchor protein 1, mitochondrial isoform X2 [Anopheles gambiae]XP_308023.6 A-kinase anchor protein 1, mitochondrial isoform X2 [Anopheles gambiae]